MLKTMCALLLAVVATSACQTGCTLIGCINGLSLNLDRPATSAYRIEVTSTGAGRYVVDCTDLRGCFNGVHLSDYRPTRAQVVITYEGRSRTTEIQPRYAVTYPNGESCGDRCEQATVTIALP